MVRIQLHLTEAQDRQLRTLARRQGTTRAELIRRGIDLVLGEHDRPDELLGLVGQAGPGPTDDGAEHHDRLLYGLEAPALPKAAERPPRLRK